MIFPTVGRVVLYRDAPSAEVWAATVTRVHAANLVDLIVFPPAAAPTVMPSVHLRQPEDEAPDFAHCHWMDYQVGQAAKYEEAQEKLDAAGE